MCDVEDVEPKIVRFGNVPKNRVVWILSAHLESPQGCACVLGGAVECRLEVDVGWEAGVRVGGWMAASGSVMVVLISRQLLLLSWRVLRLASRCGLAVLAEVFKIAKIIQK